MFPLANADILVLWDCLITWINDSSIWPLASQQTQPMSLPPQYRIDIIAFMYIPTSFFNDIVYTLESMCDWLKADEY
jgi:hypothetical protein